MQHPRTLHRWLALVLCASSLTSLCAQQSASESKRLEGEEYEKPFANPRDNPSLPNVLLIGDSISIGYTVEVRKRLADKADVFRIPGNGRNSAYGLKHLDQWIDEREWDVIHFNWGLWDLCYRHPDSKVQGNRDKVRGTLTETLEQYETNLEKIVMRLKQTNAKLIWCATTPVPENEAGRKLGDDVRYNAVAARVMKKHDIQVNDLHAHATQELPAIQIRPGDVHFSEAGYAYLAEKVSEQIARTVNSL